MCKDIKCACGPFWMPKFIRCPLSNRSNVACIEHDAMYGEGKLNRVEIDIIFLKRLLDNSKHDGHVIFAIVYYVMVRLGGIFSYKRDK